MTRRSNKKGMNWNVERRYEFMEFRLYWQGNINRSDLMEAFGISVQQASKDFANFIEGRKAYTLGVKASYLNSLEAELAYTEFFGAGQNNGSRDRDNIGLNVKYSF